MRLHALLFTDIVDSTRLVERLGDAAAAALWAEHDRRARQLLPERGGREIDRTDGLFLLFDDVQVAARYAISYHDAMAALGLSARVGLHAGPVTLRDNNPAAVARGAKPTEVEGLAKPIAARVLALARGGQTLLSAAAWQALSNELPTGAGSRSHGHYRLKGVEEPMEVFELGTAASTYTPPADVDKAYRVVRDGDLWLPLREVHHNLVRERDAFVGRGAELHALSQRLEAGARLLTLLGSGGTGKTRLARRYGLGWRGDWPGGVYFCDLSEAVSLEGIHFAVACALGVPLGKGDPVVQLGHAIAGRGRCLVILDNFEQLLAHAGATLGHWLDRAADAAFVVTSRERLHLPGEELFVVEPLALATEAVDLFAARAQAVGSGFALSDANHAAVAEVVRLLDGLPLAIELAAARVRVLSPAQIVERLKDRFKLLAGARGTAARQATLKATIDWSWDLMTGWEQAALAQCSVFEGGFTLEAAEATLDLSRWPEAPPEMDAVQALVDKSLLRCWHVVAANRYDIDEPHFGMYLSIHEYAAHKLEHSASDATLQAQQRHGRHFAGWGSDAAIEALCGRDGVKRRLALAQEIDNLMAACRRASARAEADVATPTYCAAWELLMARGPMAPAVELGAAVLGLSTLSVAQRVDVSLRRAEALGRVGQLADARAQLEQALALAQGAADRRREGQARACLGQIDREQGRMADAREHLEAALSILRETGDRIGQGTVLQNLGNLLDQLGIPDHSRACHEAALSLYIEDGNQRGIGQVRASLGILNRHQGRMRESLQEYEAALAIHREEGDRRSEGILLGNMANALDDLGREDEAQQRLQEALAIHRQVGSRIVEAYALANLALGQERRGDHAQARTLLEQALAIDREVKNLIHEGVTLTQLAGLDIVEGHFESGRTMLDKALQRHRTLGNRAYVGVSLKLSGDLLLRQLRPHEALEPLRESEAVLRDIDNPVELAELLCVKGQAALACGDAASARSALQESESIGERLGNRLGTRLAPAIAALRAAIG